GSDALVRSRPNKTGLTVQRSWLGLDIAGDESTGATGLKLEGDSATIGGDEHKERNVFGNLDAAGRIFGGDSNTITGNSFGTEPDGTVTGSSGNGRGIDVAGNSGGGADAAATGNTIGGTVTGAEATSTSCDGLCNLVTNSAVGDDIDL